MTDQELGSAPIDNDDILWRRLKSEPAFRALLRAVETRFYQQLELPQPILDLGCGDGYFAGLAFDKPLQFGVDINWGKLQNAENQGGYEMTLQAAGQDLPFPDHTFGSAISNSTLEHIPDVQSALDEISRILLPGAPFVLTVPSQHFSSYLGGVQFFNRLGLQSLSDSYSNLFNQISKHAHTDSPEVWATRLGQAGFAVERWQYYFSEQATRAFEKGHFGGIPSAVLHTLTGHWIIGPWESNLRWTEQWARPHFNEPFPKSGAFIFILARKIADTAVKPQLPPPNPFTFAELSGAELTSADNQPAAEVILAAAAAKGENDPESISKENELDLHPASEITAADRDLEPAAEASGSAGKWRPIITAAIVGFILLFAFWGQSELRSETSPPGAGWRWFGLSALLILLLIWYRSPKRQSSSPSFQLPSIKNIPRRRWLYPVALTLTFFASRLVTQGSGPHPGLALITWVAAVGLAFFALWEPLLTVQEKNRTSWLVTSQIDLLVAAVLFLIGLLPRLFQLSSHPFILNGTEASIGLDVINVINGSLANPFSTGWLTNPTLPYFLMAVPIKLLGPTVFSIRILSPFVGALTVAFVFLIGNRLYGRSIGLTAAILLLGSHFHVHYSRLGLTNVWDSLLVLLSLGFIAIAWQSNSKRNRLTWLVAGLFTGLNAYLYTSSHLLPLMLVALLLVTLLLDRSTWRQQWRNVIFMSALALVVALPELLHYQAHPEIFMERANVLGILDSQSGWLSREAAQTGTGELQLFLQQLGRASLAFNATLDTSTSYGPFVPLLNFVVGVLAVLGFFISLIRINKLHFSILFVWISVTIVFGGALLENPPGSHRYIIAAPAVMLVAAIALIELLKAIFEDSTKSVESGIPKTENRQQQILLLFVPVVIAAVLAIYDLNYYFGPYKTEHHFADRNTEIANDMANYLNSLDGDWSAYFYGPPSMYVGFSTIPFLVQDFHEGSNLFDVLEPGDALPNANSSNLTFIFLPERVNEMADTMDMYPEGKEKSFNGYYADPLFYVYEVRGNS